MQPASCIFLRMMRPLNFTLGNPSNFMKFLKQGEIILNEEWLHHL